MLLQTRPIGAADLFHIMIKIGLLNAFAFKWVNFNYVSGSIIAGLDNMVGVVIGSIAGETGSEAVFFAERFDQLIEGLSDYANQMDQQMN
jgi:type IV secretion system protein VirB6